MMSLRDCASSGAKVEMDSMTFSMCVVDGCNGEGEVVMTMVTRESIEEDISASSEIDVYG